MAYISFVETQEDISRLRSCCWILLRKGPVLSVPQLDATWTNRFHGQAPLEIWLKGFAKRKVKKWLVEGVRWYRRSRRFIPSPTGELVPCRKSYSHLSISPDNPGQPNSHAWGPNVVDHFVHRWMIYFHGSKIGCGRFINKFYVYISKKGDRYSIPNVLCLSGSDLQKLGL